ncbi:MAG: Ig-like domain-containing protein [Bacteroides sp.]|nr:Ig-like domain-containing protein [Bacteroides sp.]MCM1550533.1 Ig-like domain-containing protein [Clostridium sp.]
MRKTGRKVITGMMFAVMILSVTGCKADEIVLTDAEVATEEQKEQEPEIHLAIGQESLNVAFTLEIGESRKLDIDTDYDGDLEYLSGDEAIVTVNQEGMVTAVSNGLVKMTVTAGDVERHINVVVKEPVDVAAEEEPESTQEPEEANVAANEASNTVSSNQTVRATESKTSANGNGSNATAASVSNGTSSNTTPTEASTSTFNPEDYYLDWYYIAEQVNARLKAEYPNATIGSGFIWEGNYYEAGWWSETTKDGLEGGWTAEQQINDIYSAIKHDLDAQGIPNDVPGAAMGMVVNGITVNADGTRTISITCYR